ncbi:hypothetical protein [uncultured Psychrobacter sp.]|uniref:hypothetical protein n=1 Tax=uncultured Psychrobacter sp. TaxID=259303 RepID=UPI003458AF07
MLSFLTTTYEQITYKKTKPVYKKPLHSMLSALTIVMFSQPVSAVTDTHNSKPAPKTATSQVGYCYSEDRNQYSFSKQNSEDQHTIDCMQTQLSFYQQKDLSARQQYFADKAQAWLDYAAYEDSIGSKTAASSHALAASSMILRALQTNNEQSLSLVTAIPSFSALMRPDLWAIISALKHSALKDDNGIITAPYELAFSEVALIRAAADQCQYGVRQSGTHFRMAERWLEQAREAYVNAHDDQTNMALENLVVDYYQQYAPLDPQDDTCRGQSLASITQTPTSESKNSAPFTSTITIPTLVSTATYRIVY